MGYNKNNEHKPWQKPVTMVATTNVYLRRGPGKHTDPITIIPKDGKVSRLDIKEYRNRVPNEKWFRVAYDNEEHFQGFVCAEFLKEAADAKG